MTEQAVFAASDPPRAENGPGGRPGGEPCHDPAAAVGLARLIREQGAAVEQTVSSTLSAWRRTLAAALGRAARAAPPAVPRPRRASLHTYHPFLFHEAFPEVPLETVHELSVTDRLLTEQLLHYDRTLDRPTDWHPSLLFLAQLGQASALQRLYRLFPPTSPFWRFFFRCHKATWRSVQEEWLLQCHGWGSASVSRCLSLARGKTALLKTCTVALAFLAGRERERAWISRALDRHHTGLILLDDLEDWKEDFLRGNHTFLLTRVLLGTGLREAVEQGIPVPLRLVGEGLYAGGEAQRHLLRAEACFLEAMKTPEPFPVPLWKELNRRHLQRCRTVRRGLETCRKRTRGPTSPGPSRGEASPAEPTPPWEPVRVLLLPGVPARAALVAHRAAELYRSRFPSFSPREIALGYAAPPPGHPAAADPAKAFCQLTAPGPRGPRVLQDTRVPLRVRVVLALTWAGRRCLHGPGATLLEHIYTCGLALAVCTTLWPHGPVSRGLGLPAMARQWCGNQGPSLWERLEPFLESPCPGHGLPPGSPLLDNPLAGCPYPGAVLFFLGARFHAYVRSRSWNEDLAGGFHKKPATLAREIRCYLTR